MGTNDIGTALDCLSLRVLRDMSDGVLVLDMKGKVMFSNSVAVNILDLDNNCVGWSYSSLFDSSLPENDDFQQLILDAIYDKSVVHKSTVKYMTRERNILSLAITTSYLFDDNNKEQVGIVIVFSDITELEHIKLQRQESSTIFALSIGGLAICLFIWSFFEFIDVKISLGVMTQIIHVLAIGMLIIILKATSFSLKDVGLKIENPKGTFILAIIISVVGVIVLFGVKIILLQVNPSFFPENTSFWDWGVLRWSRIVYIFTVILQEFLARGALQASLKRVFVGRHSSLVSLIMTSLYFGMLHISFGFPYVIGAALLLGLLGILYERQKNIWGVALIHYVLGQTAIFLRFMY